MNLRDTFRREHLWVVASLPSADGSVVAVNFTTRKPGCDENCIILPGEHPFIAHETVIAYEKALVWDRAKQAFVDANPKLCPPMAPVSEALLAKIQSGALISDLMPQKMQTMVRDSMARQR